MPRKPDHPLPKQRPITTCGDLDRFAADVANDLYQPVMVIKRKELTRACVNCGGTKLTVTFRLVLRRTAVAILCDSCTTHLASDSGLRKLYRKIALAHRRGAVTGAIRKPALKNLKVWIASELAGSDSGD